MKIYSPDSFFQVIMPVGSDSQVEAKQAQIQKVAHQHGIKTHFPHYQKNFSLHATLQNLRSAEFVFVDLTFERPSCYYELGLAEATNARIYLIAAKGTNIHQTSNRGTVQFYENLQEYASVVNDIIERDRNS